jgi:hypothetical protein
MEMRGQPVEGYVVVDPPPREEAVLRDWLSLATAFVKTLPPKPVKSKSQPPGIKNREH